MMNYEFLSRSTRTAVILTALICCAMAASAADSSDSAVPVRGETQFRQAVPGRELVFPKDHGKHPDFQTEWWYFTGNLDSEGGRPWGFQLTFFRRSLLKEPPAGDSAWAIRDLYPAHFALSDIQTGEFFHADLLSREGPGLAHASDSTLDVRVKDWFARLEGDIIRVYAAEGGYALTLNLEIIKPIVRHGDAGYSRKGDNPGQASYYYSFTRLKAKGEIRFEGRTYPVTGFAWMDHEFGSSILLPDQQGWDWFSIQLDDGSELMVFHLRKKDGSSEQPFGTFVSRDGRAVDLHGETIDITATQTWESPATNAVYPAAWRVRVPAVNLELDVTPLMADQELSTSDSIGIIYWEGAVRAEGTRGGARVRGRGYVELTGYAQSMGGRL